MDGTMTTSAPCVASCWAAATRPLPSRWTSHRSNCQQKWGHLPEAPLDASRLNASLPEQPRSGTYSDSRNHSWSVPSNVHQDRVHCVNAAAVGTIN